jgi:signal peptidase I
LTVNGTPLDEPYVLDETATKDEPFEVKVRDGYLWVMGDNRGNSSDSRAHLGDPGGGQVSEDGVVGKAWLRVWPLGRAGFIHKPSQFEAVNGK